MRCENCNYYYKDDNDKFARCYFDEWFQPMYGDKAPCEETYQEDGDDYEESYEENETR